MGTVSMLPYIRCAPGFLAEFGDCANFSETNPCNKLLTDNQVKEEDRQDCIWLFCGLCSLGFDLQASLCSARKLRSSIDKSIGLGIFGYLAYLHLV